MPAAPQASQPARTPAPGRQAAAKPAAKKPASPARKASRGRNPLKELRLEDPRHALFCAPAHYVDCRAAHDRVSPELVGQPKQLFRLRYAGAATGFVKTGGRQVPVWNVPSGYATLPEVPRWEMKRAQRTRFEFVDEAGEIVYLSIFSGPFQWLDMRAGDEFVFVGELKQYGRSWYLEFEMRVPAQHANGIWTRYRGIPGRVAGERVALAVAAARIDPTAARACAAIATGETGLRENELLELCAADGEQPFASLETMLAALHTPATVEEGLRALACAKKMSAVAVQAAAQRHHSRPAHPTAPLPIDINEFDRVAAALPMPLTDDQRNVAYQLCRRMQDPVPLSALLSGDVGTGKTLAYAIPAVVAHLAGARVAIIVPRQLLADQIAREILNRFGSFVRELERVEAGGAIKNPGAILVGTPGLVTVAQQRGYVPQLLILDEQHKLSTASREALVAAGTHVVDVSATPVPRSLAASLYEGLEILNLRQCPVEKTIRSEVLDMSERTKAIGALRAALARGERAAMVYPRVANTADADAEEAGASPASGTQSVESAFASLDAAFPGKCVMLHGQLSDGELQRGIEQFRSGERPLVIASTVLEIGLDIPSIGVMIVRDADAFGISQLHQLRGRLVRNGGVGQFLMIVEAFHKAPQDALDRLNAVAATTDGYELAEFDLMQRGFGEVDGEAQTGDAPTLFRLVRLRVEDFMKRRLRALPESAVESHRRLATGTSDGTQFVQERLL